MPPVTTGLTAETVQSNIPITWPGAWHIYKYSKQAVKRNWGILLVLFIADSLVSLITHVILGKVPGLALLVNYLVSFIIQIVTIVILIACVRGRKISFGEALKSVKPILYLRYFCNILLLAFVLFGALLLLIVPFFIVLPRLLLTPYFLVDKNMGPLEAIRASWASSKGNVGKLWGIIGATLAMTLLVITIIGIPFALYFIFMYSAAYAVLYEYITQSENKTTPASVAPVVPTNGSQQPTTPHPVIG